MKLADLGTIVAITGGILTIVVSALKAVPRWANTYNRAGVQTQEWPPCEPCGSTGQDRYRPDRKCRRCGGSGRTFPGKWWRIKKAMKLFATM